MFNLLSTDTIRSEHSHSSNNGVLLSTLMLVFFLVAILFISPASAELISLTEPATIEYDGMDHSIYPGMPYGSNGIVLHVFSESTYELVPGTQYSVDLERVKEAQTYQIPVTPLGNYASYSPITVSYTVTPKEVSVTWPSETSFNYDGMTHYCRAEIGNVIGSDNVSFVFEESEAAEVGKYTAKITGLSGADAQNYKLPLSGLTHQWDIHPVTVTITANDLSLTYGDDVPQYTVSYSGFINGDDESVLQGTLVCTSPYQKYSKAGSYTITPSGLTSPNYEIRYVPGTLTVNKKILTLNSGTITANDKEYDGTTSAVIPKPDLTFYGRACPSDDVVVAFTGNFDTPEVGSNKPVYISWVVEGSDGDNYDLNPAGIPTVVYANITPQIVSIPSGGEKEYTGALLKSSLTNTPEYTVIQNEGGVDVGEYPVELELTSSKYMWAGESESSVTTQFTITPAGSGGGSSSSGGQSVWRIPTYVPTEVPTVSPTVLPVAPVVVPVKEAPTFLESILPLLILLGIILGLLLLILLLLLLFMRRSEVLAIAYVIRKNAKAAQISYSFGDSISIARIIKKTVTASDEFRGWVHLPPRYSAAGAKILDILKIEHYPLPSLALAGDILSVAERFHKKDHN